MPVSSRPPTPAADASWFDSAPVQQVLRAEQAELIPLLAAHIGVRALYLRPSAGICADLSGNMMQAVTSAYRNVGGFAGDLQFGDAELPLGNDTLSLAYLLHVIESSPEGDALLRETARALQPEGLLLALVFSPTSLWRWRWRGRDFQPWSATRLARAAQAAGLQVEELRGVGPAWPAAAAESTRSDSGIAPLLHGAVAPFRTGVALVARKRRAGMTAVGRVAPAGLRVRASPT